MNSEKEKVGAGDFRRLISRLFGYVAGHRRVIAFALLSMVLYSACKNYPIWLVRQLLSTVFNDDISTAVAQSELRDLSLMIFSAASLGALTYFLNEYFFKWISTQVMVEMRSEIMRHMLKLPLRFFHKKRMGHLISRVTNDVQVSFRTINVFLSEILLLPIMALAALGYAFFVSWQLTLFVIPLIPVVVFPVVKLGGLIKKRSRKGLESLEDTTEIMLQTISGMRTVKAFRAEESQLQRFDAANHQFRRRNLKLVKTKAQGRGIMDFIYWTAIALFVYGGGRLVISGTWGLRGEDLVAFVIAVMSIYRPLKRLASAYNNFQEALAASNRIFEILDAPVAEEKILAGQSLDGIHRKIEVQGLGFSYDDEGERTLCDVNFAIGKGETVALVGPSGAGKSTIADLIAGFYRPDSGSILIDGKDLWSLDRKDYLDHIALVSQTPFMFNTTIRENITFGRPQASEEEMVAAAKAAHVDEFVMKFPRGYDTEVGERGANLSGGQMQRITIARAILKNADLLILDEATSALDTHNERLVQEALDRLAADRTTLVIAHRLSTVRRAHRIVVLEQGRIKEIGAHEELVERRGTYADLYALQLN